MPVRRPLLRVDEESEGAAVDEASTDPERSVSGRNLEAVARRIRRQRWNPAVELDSGRVREEGRACTAGIVVHLRVDSIPVGSIGVVEIPNVCGGVA